MADAKKGTTSNSLCKVCLLLSHSLNWIIVCRTEMKLIKRLKTWISPQYHLRGLSLVNATKASMTEPFSSSFKASWTASIEWWRLWMWIPLRKITLCSTSCGADCTNPWMNLKYAASWRHRGTQSEATILRSEKKIIQYECDVLLLYEGPFVAGPTF